MSKSVFKKLNDMSVDEIIDADFQGADVSEDADRPLSAEETVEYFMQTEGLLTLEELQTLMYNKMKEL